MNHRKNNSQINKVRIIGGQHGSRHIQFPQADGLRPTSDRIRETLFNWLQDTIPHANCLDLYAGSGALGFEALSRGAKMVQFVERNRLAVDALIENKNLLNLPAAMISSSDVSSWLTAQNRTDANATKFDVVFIDPPYDARLLAKTCDQLLQADILNTGAKVYLEHRTPVISEGVPPALIQLKAKKAGNVHYSLYEYQSSLI